MNKKELISAIAEKTDYSKKDITEVIDATFVVIGEALASGKEVKITNFGKFDIAERAARKGRNPKTGESIDIAATKAPRFKASSVLKNVINS